MNWKRLEVTWEQFVAINDKTCRGYKFADSTSSTASFKSSSFLASGSLAEFSFVVEIQTQLPNRPKLQF
jgi:hypothetical protein